MKTRNILPKMSDFRRSSISDYYSDCSQESNSNLFDVTMLGNGNLIQSFVYIQSTDGAHEPKPFVAKKDSDRDDACFTIDANGMVIAASEAVKSFIGIEKDTLIGRQLALSPLLTALTEPSHNINDELSLHKEVFFRCVSPNYKSDWMAIAPRQSGQGCVQSFQIGIADPDKILPCFKGGTCFAFRDYLTGLPNRFLLVDRLQKAIAKAQRNKEMLAVIFMDLDKFKQINDTMGHAAGDQVLNRVAQRLQSTLRATDTVARFAGDEFVIVLESVSDEQTPVKVANKIADALSMPFQIKGREFNIGASLGIAIYPGDGADAETLLTNADMAMYSIKLRGGNNHHFFKPEIRQKALRRFELEKDIRSALKRREFRYFYQPIYDSKTGEIKGVEALLRWCLTSGNGQEKKYRIPAEFMEVAEETGLIVPIGFQVLEEGCRQVKSFQRKGRPDLYLSINISAQQWSQPRLVQEITKALETSGLDPACLLLEVSEGSLLADTDRTKDQLDRLYSLGIKIRLDDFGAGISSLPLLAEMPIDSLKLAQFLVNDIASDLNQASLVKAIAAMARYLNILVVAKGVELQEQADFLTSIDCNQIQGFLYSPALPPSGIEDLLDKKPLAEPGRSITELS